jgi:hypothetical protein
VVLDPASYDTLRDEKAQTTSTGGRLNFSKAIANPRLQSPSFTLNNFPTVTTGADVFVTSGSPSTWLRPFRRGQRRLAPGLVQIPASRDDRMAAGLDAQFHLPESNHQATFLF